MAEPRPEEKSSKGAEEQASKESVQPGDGPAATGEKAAAAVAREKPAPTTQRPRPAPKRQATAESKNDEAVAGGQPESAGTFAHPLAEREREAQLNRRRFLRRLTWGSIFTFLGGWAIAAARFFFPRALFEPPTVFKAGFPSEYAVGAVETKYQQSQRVWIVREADGFYAIYAKCTHLGCTPVWIDSENKFKCPCHGSGFTREGINYEGPAPRPLERVKIALSDDGQIRIDSSVVFRYERGEWDKPGAFLKV